MPETSAEPRLGFIGVGAIVYLILFRKGRHG